MPAILTPEGLNIYSNSVLMFKNYDLKKTISRLTGLN